MTEEVPQPDLERLSSLAALILLTYGAVRLARLPTFETEMRLLGLVIPVVVNTRLIMLALAVTLATLGAAWLVGSHPQASGGPRAHVQLLIPGLAALGLGALLTGIPTGPAFLIGLPLGAAALITAFSAEFYATDRMDPRFALWSLILHILGYLILLESFFVLRASGLRALFGLPVTVALCTAIAWRLLDLQGVPGSTIRPGLLVGWICTQIGLGLHYLPILPLQAAMILTLLHYAVTTLLSRHLTRSWETREALVTAGLTLVGVSAVFLIS